MLNSTAIEREFQPKYSRSWYISKLFTLVIAGAYVASKVSGENLQGLIDVLGIGAFLAIAYSLAFTIRTVQLGEKCRLHYVLWPARVFDYKEILEIRLPEIILYGKGSIKLENIVNLEELQQEFKSLELMGVIPRNHVKEPQPIPPQYSFKPKFSNIIGALLTLFVLGRHLFELSQEVDLLWVGIIAILFASEAISKLLRKPKDE